MNSQSQGVLAVTVAVCEAAWAPVRRAVSPRFDDLKRPLDDRIADGAEPLLPLIGGCGPWSACKNGVAMVGILQAAAPPALLNT